MTGIFKSGRLPARGRFSARQKRSRLWGLLFISPWIIGFSLFFIKPFIQTIVFSFGKISFDDNGYVYEFAGWYQYRYALRETVDFSKLLVAALIDLFTNVPIVLVFSFFIALLLKNKFRGRAVAQVIFFLPIIMSSGIFLGMYGGANSLSSAIDESINEVVETVTALKSLNLERYLLQSGIPAGFIDYLPHASYLRGAVFQKALPAEAGVYRHNQN